jgi:hypothetical protein
VAAKLRAIGAGAGGAPAGAGAAADDAPAAPDAVFPPGAGPDLGGDDDGEGEAGELLADLLAEAGVNGTIKLTADRIRKAKPPRRPGEPNETCVTWAREGLQFRLRRLLGRAGTLGPTAKCLVGLSGIVVSMWWGSEVIEGAARAAPAAAPPDPGPSPASPPAPETGAYAADHLDDDEQLALTVQGGAAGRFR